MGSFFFKGFELEVLPGVYTPAEDSFLLASCVEVPKNATCLDIGCGCGIQAINMALQGAKVIASDLSNEALQNTLLNVQKLGLEKRITVVKSDLFENIPKREYACIVFNPPYLPGNKKEDIAVCGGPKGYELLHRFLKEMPKYLAKTGACYFVQSSITDEKLTCKKLNELNLCFEILARGKLFFEELIVFKVFQE